MIKSIEIRNYKSVLGRGLSGEGERTSLRLEDDITTLIGKNEAGKSNILEAINRFGDFKPVTNDELSDYNQSLDETEYEDFDSVQLLCVTLDPGVKTDSTNSIRSIPWLMGPYEEADIEGLPVRVDLSEIPDLTPSSSDDPDSASDKDSGGSSHEGASLSLGQAIKKGDIVIYHYASGDHTIDIVDPDTSSDYGEHQSLIERIGPPVHIDEFLDIRYAEHLQLCWWFLENAAKVAEEYITDIEIGMSDIEPDDPKSKLSEQIQSQLLDIQSTFETVDQPDETVEELTVEYELTPPDFVEISTAADELLTRLIEIENSEPSSDLPTILDQSEIRLAKSRYDLWDDSETMVVKGLCSQGNIELEEYSAYNSDRLEKALDTAVDNISTYLNAFWDLDPTDRDSIETLSPEDTSRYEFDYELNGREIELTLKEGDGPVTPIGQRSDGMRWIITFLLSVMAQPYDQSGGRETIVTLDDPGIHLHPEAEKLLFRAFFYVTTQTQIVYTTHSPALIDRKEIDRLRIVDRETEDSSSLDFGTNIWNDIEDAKSRKGQIDPLSTAREAVGWQLSDSLFHGEETILVEGPSDKKYLETFHQFLKWEGEDNLKDPTFVNSGGDQLPFLSRILAAEDVNHVILMDDDKLHCDYDPELKDRIVYYDDIDLEGKEDHPGMEVEDLFDIDLIIRHADDKHELDPDEVREKYPDDTMAPIVDVIEECMDGGDLKKERMSDDITAEIEEALQLNPEDYKKTIKRFKAVLEKLNEELDT